MLTRDLVGKLVKVTGASRPCDNKWIGRTTMVRNSISNSWVELNIDNGKSAWHTSHLELVSDNSATIEQETNRKNLKEAAALVKNTKTFDIDVSKMSDAAKFVNDIKYKMKKKSFCDADDSLRWNPMSMENDLVIVGQDSYIGKSRSVTLGDNVHGTSGNGGPVIGSPYGTITNNNGAVTITGGCGGGAGGAGGAVTLTGVTSTGAIGGNGTTTPKKSLDQELREIDYKYDDQVSRLRAEGYSRRDRMKRQSEARAYIMNNDRTDVLLDKYLDKSAQDIGPLVFEDKPASLFSWTRAGLLTTVLGALGVAAWFLPIIIWG